MLIADVKNFTFSGRSLRDFSLNRSTASRDRPKIGRRRTSAGGHRQGAASARRGMARAQPRKGRSREETQRRREEKQTCCLTRSRRYANKRVSSVACVRRSGKAWVRSRARGYRIARVETPGSERDATSRSAPTPGKETQRDTKADIKVTLEATKAKSRRGIWRHNQDKVEQTRTLRETCWPSWRTRTSNDSRRSGW